MITSSDRSAGDVVASIGAGIAVVSHWAEVLTPILTFLIALATAAWWLIRYVQFFRGEDVVAAIVDQAAVPVPPATPEI